LFSSSFSLIITTIVFFLIIIFEARGTNLEISYQSKSLSTCENGCFNPP
jgi:hypothetical protein